MIPRSRNIDEMDKEAYFYIHMAISGDDDGGDYNGWSMFWCSTCIIGGPDLGMDVPNNSGTYNKSNMESNMETHVFEEILCIKSHGFIPKPWWKSTTASRQRVRSGSHVINMKYSRHDE